MTKWPWHVTVVSSEGFYPPLSVFSVGSLWMIFCLGSFPFWNFDSTVVADLIKKISLWVRKAHIFWCACERERKNIFLNSMPSISLWFGMMMIAPMIGSISRKSVSGCAVEQRLYPVTLPWCHQIWTYDDVSERHRVR